MAMDPKALQHHVERLDPFVDTDGEISRLAKMSHAKRYGFARKLARGIVLDAACGFGYGSSMIAENKLVDMVIGIDTSPDAIEHAEKHYIGEKLQNLGRVNFKKVDCESLEPKFPPHCFNSVISFETIEHLRKPEIFLEGVHYVLRQDGLFVVSTPLKENSRANADGTPENPFHVREFTYEEMVDLLASKGFSVKDAYFQEVFLGPAAKTMKKEAEISPPNGARGGGTIKNMLKKAFNAISIFPEIFSEPYKCPPIIGKTGRYGIYVAKPEPLGKYT